MNITFECWGLTLDATVEYFPGEAPRLSGPPDDWADGDPDDIEFEKLVCIVEDFDGKKVYDAMFLLFSADVEDLIEAALIEARVSHKDWLADQEADAASCADEDWAS